MMTSRMADLPQSPGEFENDPHIAWDKTASKWLYEDDDGAGYEWHEIARRWMPMLDEALVEQQRQAYAVPGVDESEPSKPKKRKKDSPDPVNGDADNKRARNGDRPPKAPRQSTAAYVTGLPDDTTVDELQQMFSKYGVLAEEVESGAPRIKLYTDEAGKLKGDALIVYFRPESVDLAITMMDEMPFRQGMQGNIIKIERAESSYKKQQEYTKPTGQSKKKLEKSKQKLQGKLEVWSSDEEAEPAALPKRTSRFDKVVVLQHMFTLEELAEDPDAVTDIQEDVEQECSKFGDVSKVVVFDKEERGIVTVHFTNAEAAQMCIRTMNGRFFGGQRVVAHVADGREKFEKSEGEDEARIDKFGDWLEKADGAKAAGP